MTREYSCLGPCPSDAMIALMNWQHSILEEPTFKAPWTALQNAIHLAHEVGTSSALKIDTVSVCKSHRSKRTVHFDQEVHLVIEHEDSCQKFSDRFPLDSFSQWHSVPWTMRPLHLLCDVVSPRPHVDPLPMTELISEKSSLDFDGTTLMQIASPHQLRAELPPHAWLARTDQPIAARTVLPHQHHAIDAPGDDAADATDVDFDRVPNSPSSSSSSHIQQKVCLFHLDDQPIFGRIDWTDYHQMMHEAAALLEVDDVHLLGLIDIARPLDDLPRDVTPLIAHIAGDLDPGELRHLALADIEIHANTHEAHYFTAPVVDRAVYAFPRFADRRSIFMTVDVATYCREERHRCLLRHNDHNIVTLGNPLVRVQPGDYLKITVPPPEACGWSTQRMLQFYRLQDDHFMDSSSDVSHNSGYSPSLVPSEELRRQLGLAQDDEQAMLQTALSETPWISQGLRRDVKHVIPRQCSFTEEFLRAVQLMQEAADDVPDPIQDALDVRNFAPWVQVLLDAWHADAFAGPHGTNHRAKIETWFTDHWNYQRCYNSRPAFLADNFHQWEQQLRQVWQDRILIGAPLEFHLIHPAPEDSDINVVGHLILVQRPVPFQRSIIVSVHDNDYDQGRAHSMAIVSGDLVDLPSIQTFLEANDDCPAEVLFNVCDLWIDDRQLGPREQVQVRHGQTVSFRIQRRDVAGTHHGVGLQALSDVGLDALPSSGQIVELLSAIPSGSDFDWARHLASHFRQEAMTERADEGPIAYLQTWHLDGQRAQRCFEPRTVRVRSDVSAWRPTILHAWRDLIDIRMHTDIFWVRPVPPRSSLQSFIGHLLVIQERQPGMTGILLSATAVAPTHREVQHVAILSRPAVTVNDIIDLFPIPMHLRSFPFRIQSGHDDPVQHGSFAVEDGDNLGIEIMVIDYPTVRPSDSIDIEPEAVDLLQRRLRITQAAYLAVADPLSDQHVDAVCHDPYSSTTRQPIDLAAAIPEPIWTRIDCAKAVFLRQQLLSSFPPSPSFDLTDVRCSAVSTEALCPTPPWTIEHPIGFDFYTDGSFLRQRQCAASGVVLIVHTHDGQRFGGFQTSGCWNEPSAPRAEASALSLALHWAISLAAQFEYTNVQMRFCFDSLFAGRAAQGLCHSDNNQDLTIVLRALALWLEQISTKTLQWTHIKGHSDDPWNDLVDAVARQAALSKTFTYDLHACLAMCTFDLSDFVTVQWIWLVELSMRGHPDAPVLHGTYWKFNSAAATHSKAEAHVHPLIVQQSARSLQVSQDVNISCRFATANVLTLYPQRERGASFLGARAENLAHQFRTARLQFIGLQETRCQRQGHDHFECFHVLSSSASPQGHGGVQIWILKKLPLYDGNLEITTEHLRIVHGDSRRLIVQLRHPRIKLLLIALHAPCQDDEVAMQSWWTDTSSCIPSGYSSWSWIMMGDTNGRLGSVTSRAIGDYGAEVENMRGSLFHDWLLRHNLWLPQTFKYTHSGEHATWHHPSHGHGRIDFIGLSSDIDMHETATWIHVEVDLSTARADHACVCVLRFGCG